MFCEIFLSKQLDLFWERTL